MRYVSAAAEGTNVSDAVRRNLKKVVSKDILASHKSSEPTLLLPPEYQAWTTKRSRTLIEEIAALEPTVIGDLDELMPVYAPERDNTTTDPSTIPTEQLMEAAAHGILGMSKRQARLAGKGAGKGTRQGSRRGEGGAEATPVRPRLTA